ncbi:MAG: hypothetical protein MUF01_08965 [Bryobacterales bacterium]|jgi:hypothetical protein|nr:hypothetical protein [Bryobacterales bacterium]
MNSELERQLERTFAAYRNAVVVPEARPQFSTDIWAAIEAKRSARLFGFWAKMVTSGALAASLLLGVLSSMPQRRPEPEYLAVYLDTTPSLHYDSEIGYALVDAEPGR